MWIGKIIRSCGGVLENVVQLKQNNKPTMRWWILVD